MNSLASDCLILKRNNTLTCVSTGIPPPTIHWFVENINGTIIESSDKYTVRGDQLIINDVSYSDINTEYGCVGHNFADRAPQRSLMSQFYSACSKLMFPVATNAC